ncbi:MAG: hypothetical protein HC778_07690, partial [Chamaesiphon sp. CSU_1_12]|nr:hypothetical protein [Chamaesiphon sp. CSU_1_12]
MVAPGGDLLRALVLDRRVVQRTPVETDFLAVGILIRADDHRAAFRDRLGARVRGVGVRKLGRSFEAAAGMRAVQCGEAGVNRHSQRTQMAGHRIAR